MIVKTFPQGSIEWMEARLGIPTASRFDNILTPKTMKPAKSDKYMAELLAEWLLGQPLEWGTSGAMDRGNDWEDRARKWYSLTFDVDVEQVGFCLRDDGMVGCSPDGLIGTEGGLEIKTPMALKHVEFMLGAEPDYVGQVQGAMYLTGREWWDVLSYNPDLRPMVFRVERDDGYIAKLVPVLDAFIATLNVAKERFKKDRVVRPWHPEIRAALANQGTEPV